LCAPRDVSPLAYAVQAGEERFAVELASDGGVYYDIWALSKPGSLLARLAYPVARAQQQRFARDSTAAVCRLIDSSRAKCSSQRASSA